MHNMRKKPINCSKNSKIPQNISKAPPGTAKNLYYGILERMHKMKRSKGSSSTTLLKKIKKKEKGK